MEFTDSELDIITFGLEDHLAELQKISQLPLPSDMQRAQRIAASDTASLLNKVKHELNRRKINK